MCLENEKHFQNSKFLLNYVPLPPRIRKENDLHRIPFLTRLPKKHCLKFLAGAFVLPSLRDKIRENK